MCQIIQKCCQILFRTLSGVWQGVHACMVYAYICGRIEECVCYILIIFWRIFGKIRVNRLYFILEYCSLKQLSCHPIKFFQSLICYCNLILERWFYNLFMLFVFTEIRFTMFIPLLQSLKVPHLI